MRVLCVAPRTCWPLDTGAKLRNYHLARQLATRALVSFVAFQETAGERPAGPAAGRLPAGGAASGKPGAHDTPDRPVPEALFQRVVAVPRGPAYAIGNLVRGLIGSTPLPVLNYTQPAMQHAIARLLREEAFDVVQLEGLQLAGYVDIVRESARAGPPPLVVCDWHNIESRLMAAYAEHAHGRLRRAYARLTADKLAAFERTFASAIDLHLTVSELERETLLAHAGSHLRERVIAVENGVDVEHYSDEALARAHAAMQRGGTPGEPPGTPRRTRLLFVGSMDYHANADAVQFFVQSVWPALHAEHPWLELTVVGRAPSTELRRLGEHPGVTLTGTVADVRPYYREAVASIVPLRFGGGTRLKILESMAAGVPVVSTRVGAEGLAVRDGEHLLLAETPLGLRAAVRALVCDEVRHRRLLVRARELVQTSYDWACVGARLLEVYRHVLGMRGHHLPPRKLPR